MITAPLPPHPSDADLVEAASRGITYRQLLAERANGVKLAPDDGDSARHEKIEQRECSKVFRAFGGRVWSLSQARSAKQTPGLGDLFVIFPHRRSFWWETKRQIGGRISAAQAEFHDLCNGCLEGSDHFFGGRPEAEAMVIALGLAYRDANGVLEPVRKG